MTKFTKSLAFIACMFSLGECAKNPVTGNRQLVLMSEAQEIEMGKSADPEIIAQYGLYPDSSLQKFINEKGKQMAAISHRPNLDYQFRIVDSDIINAFAVPGGYVYFTRGIMAHFNNEAEFAGVLGHEIGHIAARHSVIQQRNQMLGQIGIIAGVIIAPDLAQFAETASQGVGLLLLKFGRDAERESDRLGVEYSSKINYDAEYMAGFFNTLARQSQASGSDELPDFLSTHPNPADRNVTVSKLAKEWKAKLKLTNPMENRNSYLKRIEGLIYGEDPAQGYVENNAFYHPVLKLQFPIPQNWQYINSPTAFQMAPKDGKAMMMLTLAKGANLQEAASATLKQYNLTAVQSQEVKVNGLTALAMVADQKSEQQTLRTLSYFIQYNNNIYHIIGVSALADFDAYAASFSNTMKSFGPLSDPSKLNKKPQRVRVKTVSKASTFQEALKAYNVPEKRYEEMAVLNGMQLKDHLASGTLIKIIAE
ncbi:MAG: M48 family metalloprotease [Chitinophagaceae bacterium]|nr:M48 family metalloprotease [Chitinophagaceae bacterium]